MKRKQILLKAALKGMGITFNASSSPKGLKLKRIPNSYLFHLNRNCPFSRLSYP